MPGVTDVEPGSPAYAAWRENELAAALRALRRAPRLPRRCGRAVRAIGAGDGRCSRLSRLGHGVDPEGLAGPAADSGPDSFTAAPVAEAVDDLAAYLQGVGPTWW